MKHFKFYVIGLLFLLTGSISIAQEGAKVSMALTVSPSVSWLTPSNDGYNADGSKFGFKYGLLMDFRLFGVDNYSLASGFTVNTIGGNLSEPSSESVNGVLTASRIDANYKLTYIDVPLAIRLKTKEIGYNVFYAKFGSELGFNVGAKKKYTETYGNYISDETTNDVAGDINLFRSSLVFGLGIERNISGSTNYRIGLTYHNGLTNVMQGKALKVDSNGNTLIDNNSTAEDRDLSTKLSFIELNIAIVF